MSQNNKKVPYNDHFLYPILNPKTIVIFGANNNLLTTMGSMQLRNIRAGKGFDNGIYPIHPRLDVIQGYKAYRSVINLPLIPDLAFLILPTNVIPQVMEECGQKGIKNLLITSGGFRESGSIGRELSEKIDLIAQKYDMRFLGPNCLGVYNGWYGYPDKKNMYFNTFWPYAIPQRGNVSLVSQSGTIAAQTFWHAKEMGLKISKSISVGNEQNIDIVDCLEYLKHDPQTEVIGLYIEEIKRGKDFIKLAKEITPIKPIVAIYAGGTKAAIRSIMSHTGSITGNQKIFNSVFISTDLITEFLHYLRTPSFAKSNQVLPKGKKVAIVTDSGGSGSMMAKMLELYGLEVPEFSDDLKNEILELIPPTASASNPIDVTFDINFINLSYKFPKILMKSREIDSIIVYGVFDFDDILSIMESSGMEIDEKMKNVNLIIENAVLKPIKRLMRKYSIPVFYAGPYPYKYALYQKFNSFDVPIFELWDFPPKCLAILTHYSEYLEKVGKE
ncbi:MAG: CoA-binding protein [Promethearchaeota archaeon]